jgi:CheY-like chemotaxis protein
MAEALNELLSLEKGELNREQTAAVVTSRLRALQASCFLRILATPAQPAIAAADAANGSPRRGADLTRVIQEILATPAHPQEALEPWIEASLPAEEVLLPPTPRSPELLIEAFLLMAKDPWAQGAAHPRLTLEQVPQSQAARLELRLPAESLAVNWLETLDDWLKNPDHPLTPTSRALSMPQLVFVAEMAAELGGGLRSEVAEDGRHLKSLSILLPLQPPHEREEAASPSNTAPEPPLLLISTRGQDGRVRALSDLLRSRGCRTMALNEEAFAAMDSWEYDAPPVALLPLAPFGEPASAVVDRLVNQGLRQNLIALSALERPNQRQQVLRAGAIGYFQQPVSGETLARFIRHLGA